MALPLAPTSSAFTLPASSVATDDPINERLNVLAFYYFMASIALSVVALIALAFTF